MRCPGLLPLLPLLLLLLLLLLSLCVKDAGGASAPAAPGPIGGQFVVSGSRDRTVRVFSALAGTCVMIFVSIHSVN